LLDGAHLMGTVHGRRLNVESCCKIEFGTADWRYNLPRGDRKLQKSRAGVLIGKKDLPGALRGAEKMNCGAAIARGKRQCMGLCLLRQVFNFPVL